MNLECAVVKDMYVLYKEGELSKEVNAAVEEHLKGCPACNKVYDRGEGFKDVLGESEKFEPSKKTDERIMLSLKVKKLKIAVLFVLAVFLITSLQSYYMSRNHLRSDLSSAEHALWQMKLGIENVNSEAYGLYSEADTLHFINDRFSIINRNLNFIEKRALNENGELFLRPILLNLLDMLNQRYISDSWSQNDEKVLKRLEEKMENAVKLLTSERLTSNNQNKLLLFTHQVNIEGLAELFTDINLLSLSYYKYNKLPQEMALLSEEELKNKLTFLMGAGEIELLTQREYAKISGIADFNLVTADEKLYNIRLDAYTGDIISISMLRAEHQGEELPRDLVEKNLNAFLEKLHAEEFKYKVEYLGINHNFSSNVDIKLYTYTVIPFYDGIRVDYPLEIRVDARSGALYSLDTPRGPVPTDKIETEIMVQKEEALKGIELPEGTPTPVYEQTILLKSHLSGKIQPVHVYSHAGSKYYINAVTGKRE